MASLAPKSPTHKRSPSSSEWRLNPEELTFLSRIGTGSSAHVYKGVFRGQTVAIKVVSKKSSKIINSSSSEKAFEHECRIMKRLGSSVNIVEFKASCRRPQICIVTEYCPYGSLYNVLNNEAINVTWSLTLKWLREIVTGIQQLHSHNPPIYHRDLKALNLLVGSKFEIKVCDFGLSRFAETTNLSTLMKLRGTYQYTAPELYHISAFTSRSDIYSIGVIMWEIVRRCITGVYMRPFAEYKFIVIEYSIIIKAAKENLRPTIPPSTPPELAALIAKCWAAQPEDRPTCEEILQELDKLDKLYAGHQNEWDAVRDESRVRAGSESSISADSPLDEEDRSFLDKFLLKCREHRERKERGEESESSSSDEESDQERFEEIDLAELERRTLAAAAEIKEAKIASPAARGVPAPGSGGGTRTPTGSGLVPVLPGVARGSSPLSARLRASTTGSQTPASPQSDRDAPTRSCSLSARLGEDSPEQGRSRSADHAQVSSAEETDGEEDEMETSSEGGDAKKKKVKKGGIWSRVLSSGLSRRKKDKSKKTRDHIVHSH